MSVNDRYVISPHRPLRCLGVALIIVLLTNVLQAWYHYQDSYDSDYALAQLQTLHKQTLADHHELLKQQHQSLNSLSDYQQQLALQTAMTEELELRLGQLQQKVLDLNKELVFYQTITQGNSTSELQIREFQLRKDTTEADQYRFRIVITQGQNLNDPITGQVELALNHINADEEQSSTTAAEHSLNLRHVQVLEGAFKTEMEATPQSITVTLRQNGNTLLTRDFEWLPE
ncbi:hypothetical protein MPL1_04307 [Methylophaga lonarensis MPL]|uniref:Uncharacterized protein n=1 Tax=Methylophaga lonarensis MPL TaxID=1286106 RepID=M7NXR7_9GAMM|nr:DUF6776 family protein [Methylophaga lonarensis]EMR13588.1 hypothetical protein MPL1_04307 [Methylophaga lonarensis MPL]